VIDNTRSRIPIVLSDGENQKMPTSDGHAGGQRNPRPPIEWVGRLLCLILFLFGIVSVTASASAEEDHWVLGKPQVKDASPGTTSLHIFNTGKAALSVQIIWSGGVWSARIPAEGARTLDMKSGGTIDYVLKLGSASKEGTLEIPSALRVDWKVAYTGPVEEPTRGKPLTGTEQSVHLVLPADEFEDFEELSTLEKINALEKAVAGRYRENRQVIRALSILHNNHGLALEEKKNWDQALIHLQRAVDLDPANSGIRANLAISRHNRALSLTEAGDFLAAEREITAALDLAPDLAPDVRSTLTSSYADILVHWGIQEEEKGWRDSASRRFEHALKLNPQNSAAWVQLGEIYYARHQLDEAEECYRMAVGILPREDLQERLSQITRELAVSGDFSTSETGQFRISFEGRQNAALAQDVHSLLREAHREVGRLLRHYPREEIAVVIYDSGQFGHVTQLESWAGAAYDGKIRLRVDPAEKSDRKALLAKLKSQILHEYTHAVIHSLAGPGVPGWLHEGLAQYAVDRKEVNEEDRMYLAAHLRKGSLPRLHQLTGSLTSMADGDAVSLAYLESKAFIHFLVKEYSLRRIRTLLSSMGRGTPIGQAAKSAFGRSLDELEAEWRKSLLQGF
jgi:tetratricopeptide (TPR) repeat protein